jgi:hypothetical protein
MNPNDEELMTVYGIDFIGFFPADDECFYDNCVCGWDGVDGGEEEEEDE